MKLFDRRFWRILILAWCMAIPMGIMDDFGLPSWSIILVGIMIAIPFLIKWAIHDYKESTDGK